MNALDVLTASYTDKTEGVTTVEEYERQKIVTIDSEPYVHIDVFRELAKLGKQIDPSAMKYFCDVVERKAHEQEEKEKQEKEKQEA